MTSSEELSEVAKKLESVRKQLAEYMFHRDLDDYDEQRLINLEKEEKSLVSEFHRLSGSIIGPGYADVEKKLEKAWFQMKLDGEKPWELRKEDDHTFNVGEIVKYREYDKDKKEYTGRFLIRRVTHTCRQAPGLKRGYCLMIDEPITQGGYES